VGCFASGRGRQVGAFSVKEISTITVHTDPIGVPESTNHSLFATHIEQMQPPFVDDTRSNAPNVPFTSPGLATTFPPDMPPLPFRSSAHTDVVTSSVPLAVRKPNATFGRSTSGNNAAPEPNLHSSNVAEAQAMTVSPAGPSGTNVVDRLLSNEEEALVSRLRDEGRSLDAIVTAVRVVREVRRQENVDLVQTAEPPPQYNITEL
jgi:hypothetical protein